MMSQNNENLQSLKMDLLVSRILRTGLGLSLIFITSGLAWKWFLTGKFQFDYTLPKTNVLQFIFEELSLVAHGNFRPRLLINLGIVFLMLTPYIRVLASMIYFAFIERNRKYTAFTGFVLLTLTYSLLLR
ncbi:MAG: DUF1634 domain-containing protein [Candidatus Omnitrophica bacterium]|nr:DUF1634 domain-containing protein [Candidatus Omnitrophota bacterium]